MTKKNRPEAEEVTPEVEVMEEQAEVETEAEVVEETIDPVAAQRDEYLATAQRIQAEYDNYRKRTANIQRDSLDDGVRLALEKLIPTLDNLERALAAVPEDDESPLATGVAMVLRSFRDACTALGMEEIPALGEKFDPNCHNAVMQAPATDEYPSGTVCAVFQKGYRVRGRVVRECMVQVAQ